MIMSSCLFIISLLIAEPNSSDKVSMVHRGQNIYSLAFDDRIWLTFALNVYSDKNLNLGWLANLNSREQGEKERKSKVKKGKGKGREIKENQGRNKKDSKRL